MQLGEGHRAAVAKCSFLLPYHAEPCVGWLVGYGLQELLKKHKCKKSIEIENGFFIMCSVHGVCGARHSCPYYVCTYLELVR
jgi:hypothetical protein